MTALAEKPTAIVSSTLTKTILVSNYYFRIRCEAAMALVNVSYLCQSCNFPVLIMVRCSALFANLISWVFSIYSNSFCGIAMIPKTQTRTCSRTNMFPNPMISLTFRNTSFARYVHVAHFFLRNMNQLVYARLLFLLFRKFASRMGKHHRLYDSSSSTSSAITIIHLTP